MAKKYQITAPDGRVFEVEGDGTQEEALAHFQGQYQAQGPAPQPAATPAQPAAPMSKTRAALDRFLGAGEAALSIGTGMITAPINEALAGGVDFMSQGIPGERTGRDVMANPVRNYQPHTETGKSIIEGIGKVLAPVGKAIEWATDTENPDPAVRATGHFMNAAASALPGVGLLKRANVARKVSSAPAPTRAAIKSASQQAYAAAERTGEILPQSSYSGFIPKVEGMLAGEGADTALHPKTFTALNRLYEEATKPGVHGFSPKGAETTRKVLSNAETEAMASSAPGQMSSDARLAGMLLDEFDDFVESQMPNTTASGKAARELWARNLKAQEIERVFERAKNQAGQFSVSGMENALRTQFKSLADNPRRFDRYSADEKAAIRQVVRGGPVQNALRMAGKLAPTGAVPAVVSLLAESALPGSGLVVAATGGVARLGAAVTRKAAANRVDEMVRRGGKNPSFRQSLSPATALERLGYIPANALASDTERRKKNALTGP